jgi:K+-sensing histidine kinase KdpD
MNINTTPMPFAGVASSCYSQAEQRARMAEESERLSKILLDCISHEIRTPIAIITSAASTLSGARDPSLTRIPWAMIDEIQEATRRLNRLVSNLLNMTRLESGHVKPNLDWCDVEDLIQLTRLPLFGFPTPHVGSGPSQLARRHINNQRSQ